MHPVVRLARSRASRLTLLSHSPGHILAAGGVRHPALLLAGRAASATAAHLHRVGWGNKAESGWSYAFDATLAAAESLDERLGFDTKVLWRRARSRWRLHALYGALLPTVALTLVASPVALALTSFGNLLAAAAGVYVTLVLTAGPPARVVNAVSDHPASADMLTILERSGALRPLAAAGAMPAAALSEPQLRSLVADRLARLSPTEAALAAALAPQVPGTVDELFASVRVLAA